MNFIKNNLILSILIMLIFISCNTPEDTKVVDLCKDKVCWENSTCNIQNEEAVCFCDEGFILDGENCIVNEGVCKGVSCSNNGVCEIVNENPSCNCNNGYHVEGLECIKDITGCEPSCVENEHCKETNGTFRCVCNDNYIHNGEFCEYSCLKDNSHVNDTNNGCEPDEGYYLDDDGNYYLKVGCHADGVNCGSGVCKEDLEKDYYCECNNGFFFDGTTCKAIRCFEKITCGESCCENNQVCINDSCQDIADTDCNEDTDCLENQFCDSITNKCMIMDTENSCTYHPVIENQLTPLIKWEWPGEQNIDFPEHKNVYMAPLVTNINDDNGDGVVDLKDIPDIIFSTFTHPNNFCAHDATCDGILRVIDGKTGNEIANTSSSSFIRNYPYGEIAVGDIDNDNQNEILVYEGTYTTSSVNGKRGRVIAYDFNIVTNKLEQKWISDSAAKGLSLAIADLDHDGKPEVITGNYILNGEDGSISCSFAQSFGRMPIVEDTNNDGIMDIILGNQILSGDDCRVLVEDTERANSGYTAIADLNNDGRPEIVNINAGYLYIYDMSTMADLITPLEIDTAFTIGTKVYQPIGGPPTIGNFDEDSDLEIAVAGQEFYSVIDVDLSMGGALSFLWRSPNEDRSSRSTGSSLFDFEGDGIAEVLYADECYFRIYNGLNGDERFKIKNSSGTAREYPIVADIDNDGKSEVVVISNTYGGSQAQCGWEVDERTFGVKVFEDSNNRWVRTRRIWNQHTYHITNVNEDGSIPVTEEHNWETYNSYRLNSQGKGVFNAPDLEITSIESSRVDCPTLSFSLKITILNKGSLTVASELPISIYKGSRITPTEILGTIKTTKYLKPGESETLTYDFTPVNPDSNYNIFAIADDKVNGTGNYNECNELNNSKMISFKGVYNEYCQEGVGQCIRFAPYVCDNNNNLVCGAVAGIAVEEICDDGFDNNCDGEIDEGCGCDAGVTQECYNGNAMLLVDNSRCAKGSQTCIGGEFWDECKEDVLPIPELCNGIDDDCDGDIDEDFQVGTECSVGLGACISSGVYICDTEGNQTCDATAGIPVAEVCNNGIDDNCNGETDEKPCSL